MNPIAAYRENSVSTQSPGRLIVMLYDGAIKFLRQAITAMENEDYVEKGRLINKACDIIAELNCCLDLETGGETAVNLRKLYHFMTRHLSQSNLKRDPKGILEVMEILEDLNEGWRAVAAS